MDLMQINLPAGDTEAIDRVLDQKHPEAAQMGMRFIDSNIFAVDAAIFDEISGDVSHLRPDEPS